jgi:tetratricopeptide (TPR) repeat protein
MLVTLPFLLLLLDYWPLGRVSQHWVGGARKSSGPGTLCEPVQNPDEHLQGSDFVRDPPSSRQFAPCTQQRLALRRLLLEKLPWLALTAASCAVTRFAHQAAIVPIEVLPPSTRLLNSLVSCNAYLVKLIFPVGLAVFYPHPQDTLAVGRIAGSALLLVGISLAVLACRRKCPYLPVGWLWYLGMLVPVIGLVQVGSQAMADRYTYLSQIGLYIALAWGAERVSGNWPYRRVFCGAAAAIVVVALAWCAWQQTSHWRNSEMLWTHTLACTSRNALAHNSLGFVLASRGQVDDAIDHYRQALEIDPDYQLAHNNLGAALAGRGQVDEAIAHYRRALEIKADDELAHNNLGMALVSRGQADEAIEHFQKALEIKPNYVEAHGNLGLELASRGWLDEAIAHYRKAVEVDPNDAAGHGNLGNALAAQGKLNEAIQHYLVVLRLNPQDVLGHIQLGNALAGEGRPHEAEICFREALRLAPSNADARVCLAKALQQQGQTEEALQYYQEPLRLCPDQPEALESVARLRIARPDPKLRNTAPRP